MQNFHHQHQLSGIAGGIDPTQYNSSGRGVPIPRAQVIDVLKNLNVSLA